MLISPLVVPPFASDRNFGRIVRPQVAVAEMGGGGGGGNGGGGGGIGGERLCPGRLVIGVGIGSDDQTPLRQMNDQRLYRQ